MGERVFHEKGLILEFLKRRFLETALNNTGISSSDIGTVYEDALERVENWIDEAPPADVRPVVRGRWETDSDSVPHCTNCDSLASQKLVLDIKTLSCTARFAQSNFCPNCGADMRGGGASEID